MVYIGKIFRLNMKIKYDQDAYGFFMKITYKVTLFIYIQSLF